MNREKFVHLDGEGKSWGIVSTEQFGENIYALKYNRPEIRLGREHWQHLFTHAKDAAIDFGAKTIVARLRKEYEPEMFQSILSEIGLKKFSERVEPQSERRRIDEAT